MEQHLLQIKHQLQDTWHKVRWSLSYDRGIKVALWVSPHSSVFSCFLRLWHFNNPNFSYHVVLISPSPSSSESFSSQQCLMCNSGSCRSAYFLSPVYLSLLKKKKHFYVFFFPLPLKSQQPLKAEMFWHLKASLNDRLFKQRQFETDN